MKLPYRPLFLISLCANAVLLIYIPLSSIYRSIDGGPEIPNGRIGLLTNDVPVYDFMSNRKLFVIPKGILVKEASAYGAGWFETQRFKIIITANSDIPDYDYTNKAHNFTIAICEGCFSAQKDGNPLIYTPPNTNTKRNNK